MKNLILFALVFAMWICQPVPRTYGQCNSANGQCRAPSGLSLNAQNNLAFLQQQSAATSASSSAVAAPAAPAAVAPAFGYQMYAAPAYAAQAVVQPSQLYFMLPPANPTVPAPAPADVTVTQPPVIPQPSYYSLIGLQAGAPVAASAGGASAAAAAVAAPAAAVAPIAVNPGLAQASAVNSCANGSCSARRGLFPILGRRSSSRSVSISRSRSR